MKKFFFAAAAAVLCFSACNHLTKEEFEANRLKPESFFDFNTTGQVSIQLDYGTIGDKMCVSFYDVDPLISDESSQTNSLNENIRPVFKYFTDAQGKIDTKATVPSYATKLWAYVERIGVPTCLDMEIENGIAKFDATPKKYESAVTKAAASLSVKDLGNNFYSIIDWTGDYGKPVDMNEIISTGSLTSDNVTAIQKAFWGGKSSKPTDGSLDNTSLAVKDASEVNTTIYKKYEDGGKVYAVTDAEISFNFIAESGWNQNTVGYYYYFGDAPASPSEVKKYVIFPNASISGNAPYGATGFNSANYGAANAPISLNTKVNLLYVDDEGNVSSRFPAGITIGYFIIGNSWTVKTSSSSSSTSSNYTALSSASYSYDNYGNQTLYYKSGSNYYEVKKGTYEKSGSGWFSSKTTYYCLYYEATSSSRGKTTTTKYYLTSNGTSTSQSGQTSSSATIFTGVLYKEGSSSSSTTTSGSYIDFTQPMYYSNIEWNGSEPRVVSMSTSHGIVYGFEDSATSDKTFEDVLFMIEATPAKAIIPDDNVPDIDIDDPEEDDDDPDEPEYESLETFQTYCFEDLWPFKGDYDMNDVIIEHKSVAYFDENNYIRTVTDDFTVVNKLKSAELRDAFAIVLPPSQRGLLGVPSETYFDEETYSIIFFDDAQEQLGKTFSMERQFEANLMKISDLELDLDPYIIPENDGNTYLDEYRKEVHMAKKDGTSKINPNYLGMVDDAFFIYKDGKHPFAITLPVSVTKGEYTIPQETYAIDDEYPRYNNWVETGGAEDADWYLHYRTE